MTAVLIRVFIACCLIVSLRAQETGRLNIILIMADDLGYETVGLNGGSSYQTPNLDRLAEEGCRFSHCYSQPICTPSRVQIMTGKYNFRNYVAFGKLKRGERTFAHLLKDAGYATCVAGKWQLGKEKDSPQHFGFDQSLLWQHTRGRAHKEGKQSYDTRFENPKLERNGVEEDYHNGEFGPDLVTNFICDFISDQKDQPFLVYYPMMLTHCPWVPTPDSQEWNPKSKGSRTYKGDPKFFGAMANYMDHLVGKISKHVEKEGLMERTVLIFTGDNGTDRPIVSMWNGEEYAWGKGKTTDAGTHVPLIVHGAGVPKQTLVGDLVNFTDVLPTLCDLAGVDVPGNSSLDGQSFAPQFRGKTTKPRKYSYCWYDRAGTGKEVHVFARTKRFKLYRNGRFFNIGKDCLEETPLQDESLDEETRKTKEMLQEVIEKYQKQGA